MAEISTAGLAAIFIPFPAAVDDHQTANARALVEAGAARLLPSRPLTGADVVRSLEALLAYGINHIDVAASYAGGESEKRVGEWMGERRDTFFLATKTGQRTYEEAKADFQGSLERLQVDQVDLIQMHNLTDPDDWQTAMGPGGALEALVEAREEGLVRFIGVTGHGLTAPEMHLRSIERFEHVHAALYPGRARRLIIFVGQLAAAIGDGLVQQA